MSEFSVRKFKIIIAVLLLSGSFLFLGKINIVQAASNSYIKSFNGTLGAAEWNALKFDFINTWGQATSTGPLYIGAGTPTWPEGYSLEAQGSIKAANFSGTSMSAVVSAANVSMGNFGSNTSGGNYSFPGNLGIGTTNPLSLLQIGAPTTANSIYNTVSRIRVIGSTAQSATDEIILRFNRGENISQFYPGTADFKLGSYGSGGAGDNYAPKTRLTLALKSTSNFNEGADVDVMTLLSSGNVGIGSTTPAYKLTVNGTLYGTGAIFGSNPVYPTTIDNSGIVFNNYQQTSPATYPSSQKGFNWNISSDGAWMKVYEAGGDALEYEFGMRDNFGPPDRFVWKLNEWRGVYAGLESMVLYNGSSLSINQPTYQQGDLYLQAPRLATQLLPNRTNNLLGAQAISIIRNNQAYWNPDTGASSLIMTPNISGFNGATAVGIIIKIKDATSNPNTFSWGTGNSGNDINVLANWNGNDIPVSTSPITLTNGITISFNQTTGGVAGETFGFTVLPSSNLRVNSTGNSYLMGNVGIGTTNPTAKLHVLGNGTYSALFMNGYVGIGTTTPTDLLNIGTYTQASGTTQSEIGTGHNSTMGYNSSDTYALANVGYVQTVADGINITVASSSLWSGAKNGNIWNGAIGAGNVGIGTTNPGAKLDINGNLRLSQAWAEIEFNSGGARIGNANAANTLAFYTGGGLATSSLEKLRITSAGNVGVGMTNPQFSMHVKGDISGGRFIANLGDGNSWSGNRLEYGGYNGGPSFGWNVWVNASQSSAFLNDRSLFFGNVGIGTTNPVSKLALSSATSTFATISNTSNTRGSVGGILFSSQYESTYRKGAISFVRSEDVANRGYLSFALDSNATNSNVDSDIIGNTKMAINYLGNVGIGTTNPSSLLHLSTTQSGKTTLGNSRQIILQNSAGNVGERVEIGFGYKPTTYQPVVIGHVITDQSTWGKGDFYIATRDAVTDTAPTARLTVTAAGLVGIGTTTPTDLLNIGSYNQGATTQSSVGTGHNSTQTYSSDDSYALTNVGYVQAVASAIILGTATSTATTSMTTIAKFSGVSVSANGSNDGTKGYARANTLCKDAVTDSHVCTSFEVLFSIAAGVTMPNENVWIFNGPPGYTASSNDCEGRTSASASSYGAYWEKPTSPSYPQGRGLLGRCNTSLKLACCK